MQLATNLRFNEVTIIYSFADPLERCYVEDYIRRAKRLCETRRCRCNAVRIDNRGALQHQLEKAFERARGGPIPILQLIMHGSEAAGLCCGRDNMPWDKLLPRLRKINIATQNNLIVLGSVCFSMHLALSATIILPTPFFMFIAPEKEIEIGHLVTQSLAFLSLIFEHRNALHAYNQSLALSNHLYHCQEVLFRGLADYVRENMVGEGKRTKHKKLAQASSFLYGGKLREEQIQEIVRHHLDDIDALIARHRDPYLMGGEAGFTRQELEAFVESKFVTSENGQ